MPGVDPSLLGSFPMPIVTMARLAGVPRRERVSRNTEAWAADATLAWPTHNIPPGGHTAVAVGAKCHLVC